MTTEGSIQKRLSSHTDSPTHASTAFCIIDELGGKGDVKITPSENPSSAVLSKNNRVLWAPTDATHPEEIPLPDYAPPGQVAYDSGCVAGGSGRRVYLFHESSSDHEADGDGQPIQYPLDADLYEQIAEALGVGVDTLAQNTRINTTPEEGGDNAQYVDTNPPVIDLEAVEGHTGYVAVAKLVIDDIRPLSSC